MFLLKVNIRKQGVPLFIKGVLGNLATNPRRKHLSPARCMIWVWPSLLHYWVPRPSLCVGWVEDIWHHVGLTTSCDLDRVVDIKEECAIFVHPPCGLVLVILSVVQNFSSRKLMDSFTIAPILPVPRKVPS